MSSVPQCIGIILDGNRRWAKREGVTTMEGHRRGYECLIDTARRVRDRGIKHLVVYAFSTENWNREEGEVSNLLMLANEAIVGNAEKLAAERIRTIFVGERGRLPSNVRGSMERTEMIEMEQIDLSVWVCFSYGGRAEIAAAARRVADTGESITEDSIAGSLWTRDMPDPDIIIRTGGRHRLSNFLLWQSAYSELFFLDTLWPDFSESALDAVLLEFNERTRTFGI